MFQSWKIVLLGLPCVLIAGCMPSEAGRYCNEVGCITRELESTGKDFGERLKYCRGNPDGAKALHAEVAKTANAIIKRGKALTPPDSTEGKALHKALQSYLETQDHIIRVDFGTIAYHVGQNRMSSIMPIINAAQKAEQAKAQELQAAQRAFARANNIYLQ
jgi:hypothetical protein